MADMAVVVNGGPAYEHVNSVASGRLEFLDGACSSIVDSQTHKESPQ